MVDLPTPIPGGELRPKSWRIVLLGAATVLTATPPPAVANNFAESQAWQFQTAADRANLAVVRDMIERRRGGQYAAPIYNTTIARQYNCSIAATATGNSGAQTALANAPTVTGATSTAAGNQSATTVGDQGGVDGRQSNSGAIGSSVTGSTSASVNGAAWQALNSTQANSGDQSASVVGGAACAFGPLN